MRRRSLPTKRPLLLLFVLAGVAAVRWLWPAPVHSSPLETDPDPEGRVSRARVRAEPVIAGYFRAAGVAYPARELFLRVFKHEAELEVWARGEGPTFTLIHRYPITSTPGGPGPKRREGDRQVPEGFYQIEGFNPRSNFHLSLRVNYPNASDLILSDREKPGFDIYLHGGSRSAGCVPVGDEGIEEIYLMASEAGNRAAIPLHLFPARMSGASWAEFVAPFRTSAPELVRFWAQLQPGFDAFERTRLVPPVTVGPDGAYLVAP